MLTVPSPGWTLLAPLVAALMGACAGPATATPGTLIVLNKSGHSASLVDTVTGETRASLPTGQGPHEVAVSPDGRLAVVANYGTSQGTAFVSGHTLTVCDLEQGTVRRTIDLGRHSRPHGLAFLDPRRLVVTAEGSGNALVVDVVTGEVVTVIPTNAGGSHMVAVTPDGARAFVANIGSGSVSVLDLREGTFLRTVATGAGCEGVAVAPDGSTVWTTNRSADTLSILDADTLEVVGEVSCGVFPIRIAFTPDGERVVVSCAQSGDLAVVDVATRRELGRVAMRLDRVPEADEGLFGGQFGDSPTPVGVLVSPDGRLAYVANTDADVVAIVDLGSFEVVGTLAVGREPDGLGWWDGVPD